MEQHRFFADIKHGLKDEQVQYRLQHQQYNKQIQHTTKSYKEIIRDNLFTLFNLINLVLAALIIYVESYRNLLFLGVVTSNLVIGIFQEIRAKRTLDRLSLLQQPSITVIRDGIEKEIHVNDLVLDDICIIHTGVQIPSDAIVKEGYLEVNESNVNGESDVVIKQADDFLYSGSFVVSGHAYIQIEHVGEDNYIQKILKDAKVFHKHKSELRDSINFIIKYTGICIIPMGILLFLKQYYLLRYSFATSIVSTVAALIGMIPEGLVLLTSVALAVGAIQLARKKTLIQELYCMETLARVDVLCLDKTGTITKGEMAVKDYIAYTDDNIKQILGKMMEVLQDDNATAQAILQFTQETNDWIVEDALAFSSDRKHSSVTFQEHGTYYLGAYEFLPIKHEPYIEQQLLIYAQQAFRTLVLAHKKPGDALGSVIAVFAIHDPIREEAPDTLAYFHEQGVDVRIISGDNPLTVYQTAKRAHVIDADHYIDASTLQKEDIPYAVTKYKVFGRVTPSQKKWIIQALQQQNHTVAMIGDGVNDVMALKKADCSIAVAHGSEAAKNIANLVLLDNDFSHMPEIVAEGRRVINNIQRAASLFLIKTIFSFLLAILTLFLNSRYPFAPIQLTLISTFTIGIPAFFLALEPNHNRIKGHFVYNVLSYAAPSAILIVAYILCISLFTNLFGYDDTVRSTMCVLTTAATSFLVLIRISLPFTRLRKIVVLTMITGFLCSAIFLHSIFFLVPLDLYSLIVVIAMILSIPFFMHLFYRMLDRFLKKTL